MLTGTRQGYAPLPIPPQSYILRRTGRQETRSVCLIMRTARLTPPMSDTTPRGDQQCNEHCKQYAEIVCFLVDAFSADDGKPAQQTYQIRERVDRGDGAQPRRHQVHGMDRSAREERGDGEKLAYAHEACSRVSTMQAMMADGRHVCLRRQSSPRYTAYANNMSDCDTTFADSRDMRKKGAAQLPRVQRRRGGGWTRGVDKGRGCAAPKPKQLFAVTDWPYHTAFV